MKEKNKPINNIDNANDGKKVKRKYNYDWSVKLSGNCAKHVYCKYFTSQYLTKPCHQTNIIQLTEDSKEWKVPTSLKEVEEMAEVATEELNLVVKNGIPNKIEKIEEGIVSLPADKKKA